MWHVQLDNRPWAKVIDRYDSPQTCFYLDPPYPPDTTKYKFYPCTMTIEDHEAMIRRILMVEGKVVLSGYHTPLYDSMLHSWRTVEIPTKTVMAIQGPRAGRLEVLWMNYREDGTKIP